MQIKLYKLHNHYGKEKNYMERAYAKITLLLFFSVHQYLSDFAICYGRQKNRKERTLSVVEC